MPDPITPPTSSAAASNNASFRGSSVGVLNSGSDYTARHDAHSRSLGRRDADRRPTSERASDGREESHASPAGEDGTSPESDGKHDAPALETPADAKGRRRRAPGRDQLVRLESADGAVSG